eukprot:RCo041366
MASTAVQYSARKELLRMYRLLLQAAWKLPAIDREATISETRNHFRSLSCKTDEAELQVEMERAHSRLAFIKMMTPKIPVTTPNTTAEGPSGKTRFALRQGKVVEVTDEPVGELRSPSGPDMSSMPPSCGMGGCAQCQFRQ